MKIFSASFNEVKNYVKRIMNLLKVKNVFNQFHPRYPSNNKLSNTKVFVQRTPIHNELLFLVIVQRPASHKTTNIIQEPFYVSFIKCSDKDMNRFILTPFYINDNNQIEEVLCNLSSFEVPIVPLAKFDNDKTEDDLLLSMNQVVASLKIFNSKERENPTIKNYPFTVIQLIDINSKEVIDLISLDQIDDEAGIDHHPFFTTRGQEVAYLLLKTDGTLRMKGLGITQAHYHLISVANKWFEEHVNILEQDSEIPPNIKRKALEKLKDLYSGMTKHKDTSNAKVFKSRAHAIVFACCNLSGEQRNKILNLCDVVYEDLDVAELWRNSLLEELKCNSITAAERFGATKVIDDLYSVIISEDSAWVVEDDND